MANFFTVLLDLIKFVISIPVKTPYILEMLIELGTGLFEGAWGFGESMWIGAMDVGRVIYETFVFVSKYAVCAFQLILRFRSCFFVHIITILKLLSYVIFFWAPCRLLEVISGFD